MRQISKLLSCFFILGFLLVSMACVDNRNKELEDISFLLDDRNYDEAVIKAQALVDADPNDYEAQMLLGKALLSRSSLNGGTNCVDSDGQPLQGILGLLSCLLDAGDENLTAFETFGRIAPPADAEEDLLAATAAFTAVIDGSQNEVDVDTAYMNRFLAKMFDISLAFSLTGANGENDACNACNGEPGVCVANMTDQVADGFEADALSAEQDTRFRDNLDTIDDDGREANLPTDFDIFERADAILEDIDSAGGTLPLFFEATFGGSKRVCDQ